MEKISISAVLAYRQKVRFLTIFAFLILSFFLVQMVTKNPRLSLGAGCIENICTITSSMNILPGDTTYDNKDLTITGACPSKTVVTLYGTHTFANLTVGNCATLTHEAVTPLDMQTLDNFSSLLDTRWAQDSTGNSTQSISGGRLRHNNPTASPATTTTTFKNKMYHDFDVSVSYTSNFTASSNLSTGLRVTDGTPNNFFYIGKERSTTVNRIVSCYTGTICGSYNTTASGSRIRIFRDGAVFKSYIWLNNSWSLLGTWSTGFTGEATIELVTYNGGSYPTYDVYFDDFSVTGAGTLTHLEPDISSAAYKKVDITITNNLTIAGSPNPGSIDVDQAGYPATIENCTLYDCTDSQDTSRSGYGRGGGKNHAYGTQDGSIGGGAGYGGQGIYGVTKNVGGTPYDTSSINDFDFGSAGGYAHSDQDDNARGGPGGGRIRIVAGSINLGLGSTITADGGLGKSYDRNTLVLTSEIGRTGDQHIGHSGRGSGGTIILKFGNVTGQALVANVVSGLGANVSANGTVKTVNYDFDSSNTGYNISAIGGYWPGGNYTFLPYYNNTYFGPDTSGIGAGGRIYLESTAVASSSIKKTLIPISRGTTNCNPIGTDICFNPYALQDGDIIQVMIEIPATTPATTLTDEVLKTGTVPVKYCAHISGSEGSPSGVGSAQIISWGTTPGQTSYHYQCRVRE